MKKGTRSVALSIAMLSASLALAACEDDETPYVWLGPAKVQPVETSSGVFLVVEASGGKLLRLTSIGGEHVLEGKTRGERTCSALPLDGDPLELALIAYPEEVETVVRGELLGENGSVDCSSGDVLADYQLPVRRSVAGGNDAGDGSGGSGGSGGTGGQGGAGGGTGGQQ